MSETELSMHGLFTPGGLLIRFAAALAVIAVVGLRGGMGDFHLHVHWPHLGLLWQAAVAIRIHVAAAAVALVIGCVLLAGVKGSARHRQLGYGWVLAMFVTAASSLFIKVINPGHWSYIHFLTGWVLIALPMGVAAARRHDVRRHRRAMTGLFIGGLVIAGAFTFLPGRLMFAVFFG